MAQRPTADFNIDPNITSGTDLANILNRFQDAIDSGNSGASRPAYLAAGGLWVREGDPMRLYLYDGTTDRELYNTTDGIVDAIEDGTALGQTLAWDGSDWKAKSELIVKGDRVGINNVSPDSTLEVGDGSAFSQFYINSAGTKTVVGPSGGNFDGLAPDSVALFLETAGHPALFGTNTAESAYIATDGKRQVTVDASGRVGIGGSPSRSTKEIEDEAEATLRNWDSKDKKPTKAELVKQLTERNIGGGTAKLQVAGDGYFSGNVQVQNRTTIIGGGMIDDPIYGNNVGFGMNPGSIHPLDGVGDDNDNQVSLGRSDNRFKDAYFSGTVNAEQFADADGPIVSAFTMVKAFRKIKNAVADETTVEGIKESLTNVLGGLIEEFESIGTQES